MESMCSFAGKMLLHIDAATRAIQVQCSKKATAKSHKHKEKEEANEQTRKKITQQTRQMSIFIANMCIRFIFFCPMGNFYGINRMPGGHKNKMFQSSECTQKY